VALRSGGGSLAVAAWHDSLASEGRVRATIYTHGSWRPVVTLATSLALLDTVTVARRGAAAVRWRVWESGAASFYQAPRQGAGWGKVELRAERRSSASTWPAWRNF